MQRIAGILTLAAACCLALVTLPAEAQARHNAKPATHRSLRMPKAAKSKTPKAPKTRTRHNNSAPAVSR